MVNENMINKLEKVFDGREHEIKSVHDVERKIRIIKGTTEITESDHETAQYFFDEIIKFREFEY